MSEKTTVAFRIDESVKKEWEEAAEAPEYNSLSHLIRLAVQREITDTEGGETGISTDKNSQRDAEILELLNQIESTVTDVQAGVQALETESESENLYALEQVLLEVLPKASQDDPDTVPPGIFEKEGERVQSLADRIGADKPPVADALDRLTSETGLVDRKLGPSNDEYYYWRVE